MSFDPVAQQGAKILILGSWPSPKSWEEGFYYGHPRNRFWKLMAELLEQPIPQTIQQKKGLLVENSIALWDTLRSCEIDGASDASIRNAVPNDVAALIQKYGIKAVFCNGNAAMKFYKKFHYPHTNIQAIALPSTSPANASYSLQRLKEQWQVIKEYL